QGPYAYTRKPPVTAPTVTTAAVTIIFLVISSQSSSSPFDIRLPRDMGARSIFGSFCSIKTGGWGTTWIVGNSVKYRPPIVGVRLRKAMNAFTSRLVLKNGRPFLGSGILMVSQSGG